MKAFSPTGVQIIGTKDLIPGVANITPDTFTRDANGSLDFEWTGGTDVDWDNQMTVECPDPGMKDCFTGRVFVDEDGDEWLESQIVLKDEDDD